MNVCYVGCDARQSGTMQGEMIVDLGMDAVDMNGDGKYNSSDALLILKKAVS